MSRPAKTPAERCARCPNEKAAGSSLCESCKRAKSTRPTDGLGHKAPR